MDDDESEPQIEFTDEEWAFLRYVRFGELPRRVTHASASPCPDILSNQHHG